MIVGQLERWNDHLTGEVWEEIFTFLMSLNQDSPDEEIQLRGDKLFARIMSYATCAPEDSITEAHREYIDVQMTIVGAERIDWFPTQTLDIHTEYNPENDAAFFHRYDPAPATVNNHPGMFVVLYPDDAHAPQLWASGEPEDIKKVVVKVHRSLVE